MSGGLEKGTQIACFWQITLNLARFSATCDRIALSTYASQYVIDYFVALYFGYVVKCPTGQFLGPFFLTQHFPNKYEITSEFNRYPANVLEKKLKKEAKRIDMV